MSLIKSWKKQKLVIGDVDPTYKVKYLGNVQTALTKGEGCVDKPTSVLWGNYLKNGQTVGLDMSVTVCGSGLKAVTKEQGLTEYRAHRISYCVAHPSYPKLFVWVYRHEGKRLKVELRCHAVLLKTDAKAKLLAVQLHDKLSFALGEFLREKARRQTTRLTLQRTNSCPSSSGAGIAGVSLRNKFLSTSQNYRPPADKTSGPAKLEAINEDTIKEEEEEEEASRYEEEQEEQEELAEEVEISVIPDVHSSTSGSSSLAVEKHPSPPNLNGSQSDSGSSQGGDHVAGDIVNGLIQLEIGNDIDQLKRDLQSRPDDSDAESSESGFSEQGDKDGSASGSNGNYVTRNGDTSAPGKRHQNGELLTRNISNNNSISMKMTSETVHKPHQPTGNHGNHKEGRDCHSNSTDDASVADDVEISWL